MHAALFLIMLCACCIIFNNAEGYFSPYKHLPLGRNFPTIKKDRSRFSAVERYIDIRWYNAERKGDEGQ
jgi:hypothetical protein